MTDQEVAELALKHMRNRVIGLRRHIETCAAIPSMAGHIAKARDDLAASEAAVVELEQRAAGTWQETLL